MWEPDGWDAKWRIGVLVPHGDVGPESELQAMAPPEVRIHATRVPFGAMRAGGGMDPTIPLAPVRAFAQPPYIDDATELLAAAPIHAIMFGFTSSVFLWFCFNATLAFESAEDIDREMIDWLKGPEASRSRLRSSFEASNSPTSLFSGYLKTLMELTPIASTGRRRRRDVEITSVDDFENIVEAIYRVRCNLFHGGKRPDDPRDQKLIKVCGQILEKWVGNLATGWLVTG